MLRMFEMLVVNSYNTHRTYFFLFFFVKHEGLCRVSIRACVCVWLRVFRKLLRVQCRMFEARSQRHDERRLTTNNYKWGWISWGRQKCFFHEKSACSDQLSFASRVDITSVLLSFSCRFCVEKNLNLERTYFCLGKQKINLRIIISKKNSVPKKDSYLGDNL